MSEHVSTKQKSSTYSADRTHADNALMRLSTPEQFLISALRLWNQGRNDHGQCCCRSLLRNGFQAAGLLVTEFEIFDRVITLIDAALSDAAWIEHPHQLMLTQHETRYLCVLAHGQRGDVTEALHALRAWFAPGAERVVLTDVITFARSCAAVGLVLPYRGAYANQPIQPDPTVTPLRLLSARLH